MEQSEYSKKRYQAMVKEASPNSRVFFNSVRAFISGGFICLLGQIISNSLVSANMALDDARMLTSIILIVFSILLTGLGWYDKIAEYACAGTVVPITGFANSIAAPAIEFKREGLVLGVGAKMFIVAGPVIVYGVLTSVVIGVIRFFIRR